MCGWGVGGWVGLHGWGHKLLGDMHGGHMWG